MNFLYSLYPGLIVGLAILVMRAGMSEEAGILLAFAVALMAWLIIADVWERRTANNYSKATLNEERAKFAQAIVNLSPNDKALLAIEWPELEVDFDGKPTVCLRGTNLLLHCFQKFLNDSTDTEFASIHWYNDDKSLQETFNMSRDAVRHQWHLAAAYLVDKKLLTKDSARGSHSYQWMKGGRKRMLQWYGAAKESDYINFGNVEA